MKRMEQKQAEISLEQTWRWYGPEDPVSLTAIRQAGASGIVSALHHIPNGEVWDIPAIRERRTAIEEAGMSWSVVESVPVHEDIKTHTGKYKTYLRNYCDTITNLGTCGIKTLCYNFMPVLDWTRTSLNYQLPDGSTGLRFEKRAFAAFDLYILNRITARDDYSADEQAQAKAYFDQLDDKGINELTNNIIAGLPGAEEGYDLDQLRKRLDLYENIDDNTLRNHLFAFLRAIVPAAEDAGVRLCIHPDDPPYSILGLPRVVSTESDIRSIYKAVDSYYNGLTFCSGSLGVRADNDLPGIIHHLGQRIHFLHLRNIVRELNGDFHEADHLDGSLDMYAIMKAVIEEQKRRQGDDQCDVMIPLRPDHGHKMLDDLNKKTNPGYSAIGRLRGLAELRGLELGIKKSIN